MAQSATKVRLLDPHVWKWRLNQPVTTADTFEGQTSNLNPNGLYSTEIFKRVGTPERDDTPSYIDIKIPIFNPTYFNDMVSLKSLYADIIKGKGYAVWDDTQKDFIKSNVIEGDTGFSFFMSHFGELEPKETDSYKRKKKIAVFRRDKGIALTDKVLVIPAGIRDIDFMPNGTVSEQEVNDYYRKLIFRSAALTRDKIEEDDPIYDNIRWGLQEAFNTVDGHLLDLFKGKTGFMQRKVIRRSVFGGTRNVITARKVSVDDSRNDKVLDPNSVIIGMYQSLMAYAPINVYSLTNGFLSGVFSEGIDMAKLINRKTMKSEYTQVDIGVVEKWTSYDGLVKLFNGYSNPNLRNKPVIIDGKAVSLTYDDGKRVMLLNDIDELPPGFDPKHVHLTTYTELFYMECSPLIERKLFQVTRYPIEGLGSCFPARPIIKPANDHVGFRERFDSSGEKIGEYTFFPEYQEKPSWFDGMSISNVKIAGAGADFDGDAMSGNALMGDDTIAEVNRLFGSREYYINSSGLFLYSPVIETHEYLLRALTIG